MLRSVLARWSPPPPFRIRLYCGPLRSTERTIKQRGRALLRETKQKVKETIEKENVYTVPNLLCVTRIVLSPYLGVLIVQTRYDVALAVLGVAAVTDLLDGWIARTWRSQSSKLGSFLDPMADKTLIATLFLTLTYRDLIPLTLTGIIVLRDVALMVAGVYIRYKSLPTPRTVSSFFDASLATAQLAPTVLSKINTGVQLLLVGSTLAAPVVGYVGHPALEALWYLTGATTVASGLGYVLTRDTYKIFGKR